MSRSLWLAAGSINLAAGTWMLALRWPVWAIRAPVDLAFHAVPVVAAVNLLALMLAPRAWWLLLPLNGLCGAVIAMFTAMHYESFLAGLFAFALGTVPALFAFLARLKVN